MSRSNFHEEEDDAFFNNTTDASESISIDLYKNSIDFKLSSVRERRSRFLQQIGLAEIASQFDDPDLDEIDEIVEIERFIIPLTRDTVSENPSCSTTISEMEDNHNHNHTEKVLTLHEERINGAELVRPLERGLSDGSTNTNLSFSKKNVFKKWWSFPARWKTQAYDTDTSITEHNHHHHHHHHHNNNIPVIKEPRRTHVERHGKKKSMDFTSLFRDQEIRAHKGPIRAVKFSPCGKYLATGGEDSAVKIWGIREVESVFGWYTRGGVFSESKGRYKGIKAIEMLKRGIRSGLAIIPKRIFQIMEQPLHRFKGHSDVILDLCWSKSDCLLTASMDKTVRLWRVGSDDCIAVFQHANYVTSVQFNPINDGEFITGSIDGKVRLWQISDNRVFDWVDARHMVTSVCYRPDAKGFAVGCFNGTCRFYNIQDKTSEHAHDFYICSKKKSTGKIITSLQYPLNDSGRVMITTSDSTITITDGENVLQRYKGVSKSKTLAPASFTSDGRYIISAHENSRIHIFNLNPSTDTPLNNNQKKPELIRSCETFLCENASIAVPWPIVNHSKKPEFPHLSSPSSSSSSLYIRCFSLGARFFPLGPAVTWPEEKLIPNNNMQNNNNNMQCNLLEKLGGFVNRDVGAWSAGILTAGNDGVIRSFHNYGLPVRL